MSNKYTAKKHSRSHYKERLADRGLSKAPRMPSLADLRKKQLSPKEREVLDRTAQ